MGERVSDESQTIKIASISAFANWVGDTILYPLQTISTRLKASKDTHHDPIQYAKTTFKRDKLKLFKGVQLTFPAAFIPTFVYICVYEWGMKKITKLVEKYNYHQSTKLIFPFFVSSIAEIACLVFYLPVDTVRTRVQTNSPEFVYQSIFSSFRDIQKREGFFRFYKSSRLYFVSKTLETAITFQSFEMIRYMVGPSASWMIVNTLLSTAISTTLLNPLEVLITRYAIVDTTKKQIIFSNMVDRITKREGFKGFYKGYLTQLVHHCLYALFWLPVYQIVREKLGVQIRQ